MEQMTFKQYRNFLLNNSKYKAKYKTKDGLKIWNDLKNKHLEQWKCLLKEISKNEKIKNTVINSFIEEFSESYLLTTFRGIYSRGIENWVPKNIRKFNISNDY